ncbi:MAG: LysR family transcriptional regulator [Micavibrio aeruginosavorus]|uniref:LysR family transcriptional regulator n=1 Tax=Micavibrio aeruginosavorus TaxID=349221 RepID=A0A2W4ZMS1_9BACT|nr:MAG: LysR family transcriptional regulator [Micavibrio aeruginosavorus]
MDWDKLRIFYAVAEAGSFTHAGETLNLSQSAVSRQISTLEESIGVTLFHRHARGLILTEEGELLHTTAGEIFGKLAMIEGQIADSRQLSEGPLRITVAEFIGSTWLAPQLAKLRKDHPDIHLTMLLDDRILNLSMREADAAIRLYKPEQPDLIQRHLTDIHFHICASKDYLKSRGTPKSVKDLSEHTLIGYPENVPSPFADPNWLFRVAEVEAENAFTDTIMINSIYGIFEAVRAGAGIAALPDYMIAQNKDIVKILPDTKRAPVGVYFVYPEERRHSKRISLFRDFLLQSIEETKF